MWLYVTIAHVLVENVDGKESYVIQYWLHPYMDDTIVVFVITVLFFATIIIYSSTYTKNHVKPPRAHYFLKWNIIN